MPAVRVGEIVRQSVNIFTVDGNTVGVMVGGKDVSVAVAVGVMAVVGVGGSLLTMISGVGLIKIFG